MKRADTASRDFAGVVKAELDRKGDGRPLSDADAVKILKALRVTAEESQNAFEIAFLDKYLPQEMSETEIEAWVRANVDFGSLDRGLFNQANHSIPHSGQSSSLPKWHT